MAIVIGADPATIFSAVAPVPEGMDKFLFAGIARKRGIKLVKCKTVDLEVPANSEIVWKVMWTQRTFEWKGPLETILDIILLLNHIPLLRSQEL